MTAPAATATPVDLAWQEYQDAQHTASCDYLATVGEAQRHYDADVRAAIDTYHSVEQAAWQAYAMASRAAQRRYLQVAGPPGAGPAVPPPPPLAAAPPPRPAPGSGPYPAQPMFTPHPESEQ